MASNLVKISEKVSFLESSGSIKDKTSVLKILVSLLGKSLTTDVLDAINNAEQDESNLNYFDASGYQLAKDCEECQFKLVRLPICKTTDSSHPIYASFLKSGDVWYGTRLGTFSEVVSWCVRYFGNFEFDADQHLPRKLLVDRAKTDMAYLMEVAVQNNTARGTKEKVKTTNKIEPPVESSVPIKPASPVTEDDLKTGKMLKKELAEKKAKEKAERAKAKLDNPKKKAEQRINVRESIGGDAQVSQPEVTNKKVERNSVKEVPSKTGVLSLNDINEDDDLVIPEYEVGNKFYDMLSDSLLLQDSWTAEPDNIRRYLSSTGVRILWQLKNKARGITKYVKFNKNKTKILFSLGLLDKFGQIIKIVASIDNDFTKLNNFEIVPTKSFLMTYNFAKKDISAELERISFFDSPKDLVADISEDDCDFGDKSRLAHCVNERRYRFPEVTKAMSVETLCADLISSVKMAIKLNKVDSSYIKPVYNPNRNSVHFVAPYYVNGDYHKSPEMSIVLVQQDGFWKIMTVLPMESTASDLRLINTYASVWGI